MNNTIETLDRSALEVNQAAIIVVSLFGVFIHKPQPTALVAAVLLLGTLDRRLALFQQSYYHFLKPVKLIKPELFRGSRAPHDYVQLQGGLIMLASTVFLYLGWSVTGWTLTWVGILLATLNLFFGFCAGCRVYFQLRKHNFPGFKPAHHHGGMP